MDERKEKIPRVKRSGCERDPTGGRFLLTSTSLPYRLRAAGVRNEGSE